MEETLYKASPAMFRNNPIGFILACILCLVVVGLGILLIWWLRCKGTVLTVTGERTTLREGILSKSINEVYHSDVRNVKIQQSFFQRLLGVGSIGISSAGQSGMEIQIQGIENPDKVKQIIDECRRKSR